MINRSNMPSTRSFVLDQMPVHMVNQLHEYWRRNKAREEQTSETREAWALYFKLRRAIFPDVAEKNKVATKRCYINRTARKKAAQLAVA